MELMYEIVSIAIKLSDVSFELAYDDAVKDMGIDFANALRRIRNKYRNKVGSPV